MQAAGRYYTFIELCTSHTANFKNDILDGNVEPILVDVLNEVYFFLAENSEFKQFINNIAIFDNLLEKIDSLVNDQIE